MALHWSIRKEVHPGCTSDQGLAEGQSTAQGKGLTAFLTMQVGQVATGRRPGLLLACSRIQPLRSWTLTPITTNKATGPSEPKVELAGGLKRRTREEGSLLPCRVRGVEACGHAHLRLATSGKVGGAERPRRFALTLMVQGYSEQAGCACSTGPPVGWSCRCGVRVEVGGCHECRARVTTRMSIAGSSRRCAGSRLPWQPGTCASP